MSFDFGDGRQVLALFMKARPGLVLPGAQVFPLKNKERGLRLGEASDEANEAIYEAWRKHRGDLTKSIPFDRYRASHEPTEAQLKAGTYKKPRINFQGLRIAIENPAGSVRSGKDRDGKPWEVRMIYPYGYIERSEGVDGDQVDCYVGPNPNADLVYIVHQRKYGAWDEYDEDKVMLGFDSEEDAKAAYLQHYNDPRFLGPITVMPIEEFKQKVRATREQPAMIKGMVLFFKARVGPYFRRGKLVNLAGYERKGARPKVAPGQLSLFSDAEKPAEKPAAEQGPKRTPAPGLDAAEAARQVLAWNAKRPKSGPITGPAGWIAGWAQENGVKVSDSDEDAILAEIRNQIEAAKAPTPTDSQPEKARKFYVTMIRDPGPRQQVSLLAGPFDTHEEALSQVDAARKHAEEVDPRAVFDAFGTTGVTADKHPPGVLNARLGLTAQPSTPQKREPRILLPRKSIGRDVANSSNMINNAPVTTTNTTGEPVMKTVERGFQASWSDRDGIRVAGDLTEGDTVTLPDDGYGYTVVGTVSDVQGGEGWIRPANVQSRQPQPLPPVVDGKIRLRSLRGHAHQMRWAKGDIVQIHGDFYKVSGFKPDAYGGYVTVRLTPSTAEAFAKRPVRVKLDDASARNIGRVIDTEHGPMVVKKIVQRKFHGAMGTGYTYYGVGNLVSPEAAERAKKKDPVRVAQELRGTYSAETQVDAPPAGSEPIWEEYRMSGSDRWLEGPDGVIYYVRSDYDMGPAAWRTSATRAQIERAKKLGLRPGLA